MGDICPRCRSRDVFGKKFGMGGFSVIERKCMSCELFEWGCTKDDGFDDWYSRWRALDDEDLAELAREEALARPAEGEGEDEDENEVAAPEPERDALFDAICRDAADDELRLRYADLVAPRLPRGSPRSRPSSSSAASPLKVAPAPAVSRAS